MEVFGDAALTAALLDRLTHHAQVLLFQGESHRFRESRQRLTGTGADAAIAPREERQDTRSGEPETATGEVSTASTERRKKETKKEER